MIASRERIALDFKECLLHHLIILKEEEPLAK
jgi:hypothetical protein